MRLRVRFHRHSAEPPDSALFALYLQDLSIAAIRPRPNRIRRLAAFTSSILSFDDHLAQLLQYLKSLKLEAAEGSGEDVNAGTGDVDTSGDGGGERGCRGRHRVVPARSQ